MKSELPLCIIDLLCQYVALQNTQDFQEILDKILEIIQIFRSSNVLFIAEDMNSPMMKRFGNDREKLLERVSCENSLMHSKDGTLPVYTLAILGHLRFN